MRPLPRAPGCLKVERAGADARGAGACRWSQPFQEFDAFLAVACEYSAIVFATFPDQHGQVAERLANKCPGQQLAFVVHNSQELLRKGAGPAARRVRFTCCLLSTAPRPAARADYAHLLGLLKSADTLFLSLAPHTAVGLEAALVQLGWAAPRVAVFVPVFPIDTGLPPDAARQGFVLQGNMQGHR